MKAPLLELYFFDACPYCQKVLKVIDELNLKITYIDIYDDVNYMQKLMMITGRKTVPCLFVDGAPMHESSDIINWLRENKDRLTKKE